MPTAPVHFLPRLDLLFRRFLFPWVWLLGLFLLLSTTLAQAGSSTLQPIPDGTVFDPKTGLTWMRCAMGQTSGSTCSGTANTYTFDQANALTGTVTFANQSDWRMPNIRELQTIVDRSLVNPAIDSAAFPNIPTHFWSDSRSADDSSTAWGVRFDDGRAYSNFRSSSLAVRLVRGGQSFGASLGITRPTSDYVDHGNGMVTHTPTNLTWMRCALGQTWTGSTCSGTVSTYPFDVAKSLTGATTFAGYSDWRLPTLDELLSLVDYSIYWPAINTRIFPAFPERSSSDFWSRSPYADYRNYGWFVSFYNGYATYDDSYLRNGNAAVRLVRGGQSFGSLALTISKSGTGMGTVSSSPAGIDCGGTCSALFSSGASVTITATPATGSAFTGWSGACSGTGSCTVSMTAAQSVTATFITSTLQPNVDGTVLDTKTGLTWMRCAMGQTWDGSTCIGAANAYTFDQANALTGTVTFTGQSDWRMPNIRELQTIVNRSVYNPAVDSVAFPNTPSSRFWSGSPDAFRPNGVGWSVLFTFGDAVRDYRDFSYAVRLVRGGQSLRPLLDITRPTSDYVDNGNSTVTHMPTNLTWMRCAQGLTWTGSTCSGIASTYTLDQAKALTGATTFAGQSDWRLPTEDELLSLVDYTIDYPGPMINRSIFPETPSLNFWSSSLYTDNSYYSYCAWVVLFDDGSSGLGCGDGKAVRLVRGGQSLGSFFSLTISKSGTGMGIVTSSPAGIDCGSTCSAFFTSGASVTLTATPATGSTFTGWSGACSGTGSCTVSMTSAQSVTATFAQSVVTTPVCTLSANPATITVGSGTTLTATCTPAATSYVWSGGACVGTTGATCTATPTATTTYTVAGTNTGGTGAPASATVTVTTPSTSTLQPNADGTVFDQKTGLTWMRCAMGQVWNGSTCTGTANTYTFDQANALTTVTFAGQSDWRLPNIRELQTIVDRSVLRPAIDSGAFPNTPSSDFWSDSPNANDVWSVYFGDGYAYSVYGRLNSLAVRLVRGGQSFGPLLSITRSTSDYVDNGNGTVTHTPTNLTWKHCAEGQTWTGSTCSGTPSAYTFEQANVLTGTTTFANQSDWRVPTEDELLSLVDYTTTNPAINGSVFPVTSNSYFWSGSPVANYSNDAWYVRFSDGYAGYYNPYGTSFAVRLVRGGQSFGSFALTISKSGTGTITSSPAGIDCGSTCSASFTSGASVTLTATPASGSTFTSWSGSCTGTGSCTVSMTAVQSVTATFAQSVSAPVCTLSTNPGTITADSSSTLTATCSPAATSYTWTGGTCAGTSGSICVVAPTATTAYSVRGTNSGGTGDAASATVTVTANVCTYTLSTTAVSVGAAASTSNIISVATSPSTCAWTATSNASWITITGASGSGPGNVFYAVAANTSTTLRTGTLTVAGKTFTVTQAAGSTVVTAPVCTLSANPASITAGGSSTLTATCNPAATSYIWTGGTCEGTSGSTCIVKPTATTTYSVQGINAGGANQATSAAVTVTANTASYTVPGTLGNDVFVLTAGNSYYGGAGNDTFIISPNTLRSDVTAKIIDTEGDNIIQLVDGMTVTASSFYTDAAELTLSNGAKVQILGASRFKYQVGANALAGDTAAVLNYTDFVASLGASLSGTLPASGTAGYVVPTAFTQASAPVPAVAGISSTVPGTLADDVLVPSGGNNYLGGGGNDTYIISPYTLSGTVTAKIVDTEGSNVIQLVNGLTIASSSFFNNAMQLMLSNGAIVQILGASGFSYQLGANAPAGETAASLSYAQFAAALGASVPATGAAAVSGTANFLVTK